MDKVTGMTCAVIIVAISTLGWAVDHYRSNAITYKGQRDIARESLAIADTTIADFKSRQREVAALDAKYTKELADAQTTIDQLQRDVSAGKRRLQLNATCKMQSATRSSGVGDDATPGLTAAAEQDYWHLRTGITTITKQVKYLQQYIREQCLK